ncbi:MAG: hypothetical protein ACQEXJ_00900 [Myxococcota bacterium]
MSRTVRRIATALAALSLAGVAACGPSTWRAAADGAAERAAVGEASAEDRAAAGEMALLVDHDPDRAAEHLVAALRAAPPSGPVAARAALGLAEIAAVTGRAGLVVEAAPVMAATTDPHVAEALARAAGLAWGRLPDAGPTPDALVEALRAVADRAGAAWEPVRTAARGALLAAADLVGSNEEVAAARADAGLVTAWRLSAPHGTSPEVDLGRSLGPERTGLGGEDAPVTGRLETGGPIPTWGLERGGGVLFAEAWIALPDAVADRRVVLRAASNRSVAVRVGTREVLTLDRAARDAPWEEAVTLRLPRGPVRVLVKLASHDRGGSARIRVSHLAGSGLVTRVEPADAPQVPVDVSEAPASFVDGFPTRFDVGEGGGAIRALHVLRGLLARPHLHLDRARRLLDALHGRLGEYPGLWLAEARADRLDPALTPAATRSRMRRDLERVLDVRPRSREALRRYGAIERDDERPDPAAEAWERALEEAPRDPGLLAELTALHRAQAREAEALATADRIAALPPTDPRAMRAAAMAYRAFGHADRARRVAEAAAAAFPGAGRLLLAGLDEDAGALVARARRLEGVAARQPHRLGLMRRAVEAWRAAGRLDEARRLVDALLAARPDDQGALQARVLLALQANDREAALEALDATLTAHPDAVSAEVLARWLTGDRGDLGSVADGADVLARWREAPPEERALADGWPAVTVLDRKVHHVRRDGTVITLEHAVRVVQTRSGADALGEVRPPNGSRLLVARTLQEDGDVLWPERVEGKPDLSFSGLQPGDAIETAWVRYRRVDPEAGGWLGREAFASFHVPTWRKALDVVVDPGLEPRLRRSRGAPEPQRSHIHGGQTLHRWRLEGLPAVSSEPHAPSAEHVLPTVALAVAPRDGGGDAWAVIAARAAGELRRLTRPGHHLEEALAEALPEEVPREEAVRRLFAWARSEIDETEPLAGWQTSAEAVVERGEGSRVVALMGLARTLGLPGEVLLCATHHRGPAPDLDEALPRAEAIAWPVVRFRVDGGWRYADPHLPWAPFGVLPAPVYGSRCLRTGGVEDREALEWVRLPEGPPDDLPEPGWRVHATLHPDVEEESRATVVVEGFGPETTALRQLHGRLDEARRSVLFQQWMGRVLPGAQVDDVRVEHMDVADRPLRIRLEVSLAGLVQAGDGVPGTIPRIGPVLWTEPVSGAAPVDGLLSLPRRETSLWLPPHREEAVVEIVAADDTRLDTDLRDVDAGGATWSLQQTVSGGAERLRVKRRVHFGIGLVGPEDYTGFRRRITRAVDAMSRSVTLRR